MMLSIHLRVELLVVALFFILMVIRNVNKKKLLLQYSLVWLAMAVAMIIAAVFPRTVVVLTAAAGIAQPSNFVYAVGLFVLLFIAFNFTAKLSKQSSEIRNLTEQEAIDRFFLLQDTKIEEKAPEGVGGRKPNETEGK